MTKPIEILKKYWGFDTFIEPQEEIISSVLSKRDTLALLPTGGGKSLCFQLPTLLNDGICVVVSPLIALMNDQVKNLAQKGIKAIQLTSKQSQDEIVMLFDNLLYGNYKFLYLSPEKLQSEFIQTKIQHLDIQLFAIDEAHCISEWGHDFRPSYLNINKLSQLHPNVPFIALTASATPKVTNDIIDNIGMTNPTIIKKSFYRKNLGYRIINVEDKLSKIKNLIEQVNGSTIIYTNTRRKTVELSEQLNQMNFNSTFYHGGMFIEDKLKHYENWLSEKTPIIVATNAFGMGIDKANVRLIIHHNLPQSIENYMQEAGRGGRDNKNAYSYVLSNKNEINELKTLTHKTLATKKHIEQVYLKLNQYFNISYGELNETSFEFDLSAFCKTYNFSKVLVYNSLKVLNRESILFLDENIDRKSTAKFITSNTVVFNYAERNKKFDKLIKLLLRTYGGIFENSIKLNETYLANTLNISKNILKEYFTTLHNDKIISYYNSSATTHIRFLVPREDKITINIIARNIEQLNKQKTNKVNELIKFIENDNICRSIQLLSYFGESEVNNCGICDVCVSKKKKPINFKETYMIVLQLLKNKEYSSQELISKIEADEKQILFALQLLLDKNLITVTLQNKYKLL